MTKQMSGLLIAGVLLGTSLIMGGCDSGSSKTDSDGSLFETTTITYEVDPQKEVYAPNENVVITATISGPHAADLGVLWSFSIKNGNVASFPIQTANAFEFVTGQAGTSFNVTAEPSKSISKNGVELIRGSESFTFNIEAPAGE